MHIKELNHFEIVIYKVTKECNNNCAYCYESKDNNVEFNHDKAIEVIKEIDSNNDREYQLIFHGGEPLLRVNTIRKAVKSTKSVSNYGIQTNGKILSNNLLKELKSIYNDFSIGVSLDSLSDDARGTQASNFNVFENFLRAREIFKNVGIIITLNKTNHQTVFDLLNILKDNDVNQIKINNVFCENNLMLTEYETERFWKKFLVYYSDFFYEENSNIILSKLKNRGFLNSTCNSLYCSAGKRIICVNSIGAVLPCGRWSNKYSFYANDKVPSMCLKCKNAIYCGNGCKIWNHDYNFFKNECIMNKTIIEFYGV